MPTPQTQSPVLSASSTNPRPPSYNSLNRLAQEAARAAGRLMKKNLHEKKRINDASQHDIKLELDVRCQNTIEAILDRGFPEAAVLGEEGVSGDPHAPYRWVVDPIDGTVNFTYGIPHACVSIALDARKPDGSYETVVGVVYDPFVDEMWTAIRGKPALLNGRPISVSSRSRMDETIISLGFAKYRKTLDRMLPTMTGLIHKVRKVRITGSAALSLVYVASGRFDAYLEYGLRWWDIAAGGLILECAGGDFAQRPIAGEHTHQLLANNGKIRKALERYYAWD